MDPSKIHPCNAHILVRRKPEDETTPGGLLVIPERHRGERGLPRGRGTVLAIGPGSRETKIDPRDTERKRRVPTGRRIPVDVAVGSEVIFSRLSGIPVEGDDELVLIDEQHVMLAIGEE